MTPDAENAKVFDFGHEDNSNKDTSADYDNFVDNFTGPALEKADKIPFFKERILQTCELAHAFGAI